MKIKNVELKTFQGKTIMNNGNPVTLAEVSGDCVARLDERESAMTPDKELIKLKKEDYLLCEKLLSSKKEIELTAEEIVRIKGKVARFQDGLVAGQCILILDGK